MASGDARNLALEYAKGFEELARMEVDRRHLNERISGAEERLVRKRAELHAALPEEGVVVVRRDMQNVSPKAILVRGTRGGAIVMIEVPIVAEKPQDLTALETVMAE